MRDRSDYLTQAEQEALKNEALRQHARTIDTYLSLAALTALSDEQVTQGIDRIRSTDKKEARRIHRGLFQAVETLETLLESARETDEITIPSAITEPDQVAAPFIEDEVETDDAEFVEPTEMSDDEFVADERPVELVKAIEQRVDQPALQENGYLQKLLHASDDQLVGVSPSMAAKVLYEMAGSPAARRNQAGNRPDLVLRLERRLSGVNVEEIARLDQTTPGSVSQWFVGIQSKIKKTFNAHALNSFNERVAQKQTDPIPGDVALVIDETPPITEQEREPAEEYDARESMMHGSYDDDHVLLSFEHVLGELTEDQREALSVWLATDTRQVPSSDYANDHADLAHMIIERLPRDFEGVGVVGAEKVSLRKLLGMYSQNGRPVYKPPETAEQILHKSDSHTARQFSSAVAKLLIYLEGTATHSTIPTPLEVVRPVTTQEDSQDMDAVLRQVGQSDLDRQQWLALAEDCTRRQLKEYFTDDESDMLWQRLHFGADGEHIEETKGLAPVLKKIEVLFVEKNGKDHKLSDRSSSMFKMFFMTFQGVQSLESIYEKFSSRDPGITKDDVERFVVAELNGLLRS